MNLQWIEIAFPIALAALAFIITYAVYLKKLVKEGKELYEVVKDALADRQITKTELQQIFKEAEDVGQVVIEITKLMGKK